MERRFKGLRAVTLIAVITFLGFCSGHSRVQFTTSVIEHPERDFAETGNDVMLLCETKDNPSTIEIKRLGDENALNRSQGRVQSFSHLFTSVTCNDMATYECLVDNGHRDTTNVTVIDCGPRPCQDDDINRTVYVALNKSVQLSLCVLAYPDIFEYAEFNNIPVRKKHPSNQISWMWDYEEIKSVTDPAKSCNITVSRDKMVSGEYGLLNIRVSTITGRQYFLNYNILLQPPGPPECPSDVRTKDQGHDYVLLSWKPGLDRGSKQSFHVYFSKDNETWDRRDGISDNSANITGLEANTSYVFSVASSNRDRRNVNESVCRNSIALVLAKMSPEARAGEQRNGHQQLQNKNHDHESETGDKSQASAMDIRGNSSKVDSEIFITIAVCALLLFLLLLSALIGWRLRVHCRKQVKTDEEGNPRNDGSEMMRTCDDSKMDSENYISQEGLKYISVIHLQNKVQKKKARGKKREKQEKIQYTVLDFSKTGQVHQ